MSLFTLHLVDSMPTIPPDEPRFWMCPRCYAAYHGIRLGGNRCIKCTNGSLVRAMPEPNPPPPSPRHMVCDRCGYIITGRRTRETHKAACHCITVHPLFKESR